MSPSMNRHSGDKSFSLLFYIKLLALQKKKKKANHSFDPLFRIV